MERAAGRVHLGAMCGKGLDNEDARQPLFARGDVIFTAAALSLLVGLIVPLGPKMLDILWACSLCLTFALILVPLSARQAAELRSFPLLLLGGTLFHIVLMIASAKLIFLDSVGGQIIEFLGRPIASSNPIWPAIVLPIAGFVIANVIGHASNRVCRASTLFMEEILPLKRMSVEADLNSGAITDDEAGVLRERLATETAVYLNMGGAARLLICDGIFAALVVIVTSLGQVALAAIQNLSAHTPMRLFMSLAAGTALLCLLPSLLIALSCAYMVGKRSLTLGESEDTEHRRSKKIEIERMVDGQSEEVELLNPEFTEVAAGRNDKGLIETEAKTASFETAENEPEAEETTITEEWSARRFATMDDYHGHIVELIDGTDDETSPVLLAAEKVEDLPVTVAVRTGMKLAGRGKSVVLVDLDSQRNALARVFDVVEEVEDAKIIETCIENLSVCYIAGDGNLSAEALQGRLSQLQSQKDCVLMYAPNLNAQPQPVVLAHLGKTAIVFSEKGPENSEVYRLIADGTTKVLDVLAGPDEAVEEDAA